MCDPGGQVGLGQITLGQVNIKMQVTEKYEA